MPTMAEHAPDSATADTHTATLQALGEARAPMAMPAHAPTPRAIGRYRVVEMLAQGGMGVVYMAHDPELDRMVALKLISSTGDEDRLQHRQDLLAREAQALARLAHPNIVAIHDVGMHAGQVFVAMEFVAGLSMREWWRERRPDWQAVLAAMVQAGRGIVAAHAAGLVHRDIKPDNLLVGDDGRVRVADFGIARVDASAVESSVSEASTLSSGHREFATIGAVAGTPMYMAPEQHERGDIGPHSDQFSFCVTLWEGLFGQRPFHGETADLPGLIRRGALMLPAQRPDLPRWLERAVRRGLAGEPADRWPSMQALLDALALDVRRNRRRWRAAFAALAAVGCVALVLGGRALQASWARLAAEQAAAERLQGLRATVAERLATGQRKEAEEAVRAFVQEPALRDTRAGLDAWLMWADHMDTLGDRATAQAAVVEAYLALPEDDPREPAIALRIAHQFRAGWQFHELAALGEQVHERWPTLAHAPVWAGLRAEAALARGDLVSFLAMVDSAPVGDEYRAVAPAVRALASARCPLTEGVITGQTHWPGADGPQLLLAPAEPGASPASLRRMDVALTPVGPDIAHLSFFGRGNHEQPLVRTPGGPAYLLDYTQPTTKEITLYELGDGAPRPVLRWPDHAPASSAAADLDGDGLREIYVGTGTYTRKFYRLEPDAQGAWQRRSAHPPTDAIASDINALVPGDFNGDGRLELAAAVGAWRAYDVRIFEAGPDGELQVVARRRFGHVRAMKALRAADGTTLLALAKDDTARSKVAWAPNQPQGEAAGLHIVRRQGDTLVPVAYVPWPTDGGERSPGALGLAVGDFDGDGLDDVAATVTTAGKLVMLLLRQLPEGRFAHAMLGAIEPQMAGNFDDDPEAELLAQVRRGDSLQLCVLGVEGDPVQAEPVPHVIADTPALADPLLARAWTLAENLAGFGLYKDAARALASRITLANSEADRRALARRTGELFEAAGESGLAAERFAALAEHGDVALALRAVVNFEQAMRMAEALQVVRTALRRDGLTPVQQRELRAAHERLLAVEGRNAWVEPRFDTPLAPAWQIHEPLALRVDAVHGELVVDTTADMGPLASFPIELTGEPLTLEVDIDVERAEWGTRLGVSIVPLAGGTPLAELAVSAGGGGGYLYRHDLFEWEFGGWETPDPAERSSHRLRATLLPGHARVMLTDTGSHPTELSKVFTDPIVPGRYAVVLQSVGNPDLATQHIRAKIRRIALLGARPPANIATLSSRDHIARDLVSGRWHAALDAGDDALPELRLWRAVALAELGRTTDAIAAFAAIDPAAPALRRPLRQLLRSHHATFGALLRAAFGPRYAALLLESLQTKGEYHDEELWALQLAMTADLEGLMTDAAEQHETLAELLALRGRARMSVGTIELAEADLAAAASLYTRWLAAKAEARDPRLATAELWRAEIATRRGMFDDAFAAAERALHTATDPEWMAERMRISPALGPLHADKRWLALLASYP